MKEGLGEGEGVEVAGESQRESCWRVLSPLLPKDAPPGYVCLLM